MQGDFVTSHEFPLRNLSIFDHESWIVYRKKLNIADNYRRKQFIMKSHLYLSSFIFDLSAVFRSQSAPCRIVKRIVEG